MNASRDDRTTTNDPEHTTEEMKEGNRNDTMRQNERETIEEEPRSGESGDDIEKLRADLAAARQETAEHYDRLLRATAEFENYKKRTQRQVEEHRRFANESLLRELLSVVDNLERAVNASPENPSQEDSRVIEGVQMTLNEILKIFEKYNVTPLESRGRPFDPAFHEAIMQAESDEHPENTVINEFQKGYLLHDRLLRPAMVVVSKGK